ncbi:MAG: septum site-determining protein MinC [Methylobacter sp.]|uniref:septum site-determining protein MinC n=1 Tax=Methylobacter sp. TaxID=2051955 RepID=UPI00258EC899|nr:septum site-determining protein MinC [Methylobacter sp.]MCL7420987.1 septum site-determining protein MinC [Methylobacter sp.]
MSTDPQTTPYRPPALEFKSSTFSVPVLILFDNDTVIIEQQLQEKVRQAPEFFKNSPLVFDLQELNKQEREVDIAELTKIIRKLNLLPIGIRGGTAQQNQQAITLGIPVHSIHSGSTSASAPAPAPAETVKSKKITPKPDPKAEPAISTLITQPIRSGQRLYAEGDLIVLAQVSAGAEILAEGNIHVYGTLRGRALAGVQGNQEARIFCSDLQAELISIAGTYKISEDLDESVRGRHIQIYLQNENLIIQDL